MLIALLLALGVNLIVIVAIVAMVAARKRWVMRQPGAFRGVIRVSSGEVEGLRPKWSRGYGRWVRDVLVWTKAPFLFRTESLPADGVDEQPPAPLAEVKHLGDHPVVARVTVGQAAIDVAADGDDHELLLGPYRRSDDTPTQ
jgi:hypothetical protein